MGVQIKKAGWQTMVMDQGRPLTRHMGIPVSGVIDLCQYWWACGLTGQYDFSGSGPAVLEIRSGSVEIVFDSSHTIALTGSQGEFFIQEEVIFSHTPYHVNENQVLKIRNIERNGTVYLAIGGHWEASRAYGSSAADILTPFPGTAGRMLTNEDYLEINVKEDVTDLPKHSPDYIKHSSLESDQILRITAGPELYLSDTIKRMLHEDTYSITRQSNRMGYRMETTSENKVDFPSMISSIVLPGMIQWPSANQPILLLPNCQTTGGYPRVAKVIDADMWKLAYVGPGDKIKFQWTTREEALYLRNYELGQFTRLWNDTFPYPIKNHSLMY